MSPTVKQRSQLLRLALWSVLVLAALALIGLIFEWINFTRAMPEDGRRMPLLRLVLLGVANLVFTGFLVAILLLTLWAKKARSLPDLKGWHTEMPASEFRAADAVGGYTLEDYLIQEDRVFAELADRIEHSWSHQAPGDYSRFNPNSICNPETIVDRNWNRTHMVQSPNPVGGALLLHGLSDSPYSLRAMGQRLVAEGYTVVWLRIPGHGTTPRALAEVSWEDWTAAVEVAVKGLKAVLPAGLPIVLGGYSNGGALSLHYALSTIENDSLPKADAIVLFSPMVGVNPLARITRLYHTVGLVSRNEKTKWSSIFAEIDPFKYSSWPMNANVQAWNATQAVERKLAAVEKSQRMDELPPVLAMQSVVDSTVVVPKLITVLFDRLTTAASQLLLFDINRKDSLSNLLNLSFEKSVLPTLERTDRPFRLMVLGNITRDSDQLSLKIRDHGEWSEQAVDLSWPQGVVSLSHVAVPIPEDDPIYGESDNGSALSLGTLSMRAEPSALMIPSSMFVRCRRNPFYGFMEDRVIEWLSETVSRTAQKV